MRSKNLLPVQVVMPSNWMGGGHSSHKATFEEALHSSIENSLRSPSVPPSAVFSSLFFTYLPSSSSDSSNSSDVKPNIEELSVEVSHPTSVPSALTERNPSSAALTYAQRVRTDDSGSEIRGSAAPLASTSSEDLQHVQLSERKSTHLDVRPPIAPPPPQLPLLAQQQQQLEQIQNARIEQLKQFHKLQAWQQMQKEQQSGSRFLLPISATRDQHPANHCGSVAMRPNVAAVPRSSSANATPVQMNGLLRNGTLPPLHTAINFRHDASNLRYPHHGFCKAGKDIRLSTFENDCSKMLAFPAEYILLALQPVLAKADLMVVVAINLKSLPPHGTSSQALSAQCLGCGDKSIHTFSQLATHMRIEPAPDPNNTRLNSTQLIGPYARFYLVRDASNPHKLARGSTAMWYKTNEERMRSLIPPAVATSASPNQSSSLFRGSMIMVSPPHQETCSPPVTVVRDGTPAVLFSPNQGVPVTRPHLKRALSSPIKKSPAEPGKRQFTSLSQGDVVVVNDGPTPKRYVLDRVEPRPTVQIPEDFSTKHERKPVVAFLSPIAVLPHFAGDSTSLLVTSQFSECFKPLSREAKARLGIADHCPLTVDKLMLLTTVQYLINLGLNKSFSMEDLSSSLMQAHRRLSKEGSFLSEIKSTVVLALCQLAAATSAGSVELINCKNTLCDGFSECLQNSHASASKYQLLVYIEEKSEKEEIHFHLFITGKFCRVIEERLESREQRAVVISEGLVSYQFSQLHLSLSDVARKCFSNRPNSNLTSAFDERHSPVVQHKCVAFRKGVHLVATSLLIAVEKIFDRVEDVDLSDYTALRFMFLLPPSPSALSETVRSISESTAALKSAAISRDLAAYLMPSQWSDILTDLFEASLPASSLASQVVMTTETASLHRVSTVCEQLGNSPSLLFLIQLDPHSSRNSSEVHVYLESPAFRKAKNIFTIQCSAFPYSLLTEASRISSSNIVSFKENGFFERSCELSTIFDPIFEFHKQSLLDKYESLHSLLVVSELLTQHYVTSLSLMSSSDEAKTDNNKLDSNQTSSLITNQIARELVCRHTSSSIVIVRITSSILASRFFDSIKRARKKLGLEKVFEVLLYKPGDAASGLSLSSYFLELLQRCHDSDWIPASLNDLCGIPCLVVYEGSEVVAELMPRTLKYVDLRMAFTGALTRFEIEQEMSFATPLCLPRAVHDDHVTNNTNQSDSMKKNGADCVADQPGIAAPREGSQGENGRSFKWQSGPENHLENGFRRKLEEDFSDSKQEVLLDFIGLAMKEADLPADGKCKGSHVTPLVVLPENVYDVIKNKSSLSLFDLPPHPTCQWKDPLHPRLNEKLSINEQASYYRQLTVPTNRNPDFVNKEHVVDDKRLLLVASPGCPSVQVCCQFLHLLHCKLMKALDVMVYDDPEEEVQEAAEFYSLVPNNVTRGLSQVVNSCFDAEKLSTFVCSDQASIQRRVVTRHCKYALTSLKRLQAPMTNGFHRAEFVVPLSSDDGSQFRILIPPAQNGNFRFSTTNDGSVECASLILKRNDDSGIKTPVVSIAMHGPGEGLFNTSSAGHGFTHLVIVKACDADSFKSNSTNHVVVVLPAHLDFLGKGALKCAAQTVFDHFYANERNHSPDPELVWPFFLLRDDDVAAFTMLRRSGDNHANSASWSDVSLRDVISEFELFANDNLAAVGFRPWSGNLPTSVPRATVYCVENSFNHSCVESCIFVNAKLTSSIKFTATKFYCEDVDWSLRVAAAGLNLFRFENIALVTKAMSPHSNDVQLTNTQTSLVAAADSEFEPLCHHPGMLLERYLQQYGPLIFPRALDVPSLPILCVDCYLSLGNRICLQFVSTFSGAEAWATKQREQFGGLIVSSSSNNVDPNFLKQFHFVSGAVVCVIGADRNVLRQTIVHLQLESNWHFRLTDEFQTTNHPTLGGTRVRPFYFLTGVKKES